MPELLNTKHEAYCQAMITEDGVPKAVMEKCGYKYSASFFSQLKRMPKNAARISELRAAGINESILTLTSRLEMLSDIASNPANAVTSRIQALRELHVQSGDSVKQLDVNMNSTAQSVVRFVDVALPKKQDLVDAGEELVLSGKELVSLDEFLKDIETDPDDLDDL